MTDESHLYETLRTSENQRLIFAGFMGTGKSTVGKICARRLGYEFIDLDTEIEREAGLSIPQIFDRHSESYFRALEARLIERILKPTRTKIVLATGGGAVKDPNNRQRLLNAGTVICLTATPETIIRRTSDSDRPLLQDADVKVKVEKLLRERAPMYRALHYHVDTTRLAPEEVAERVLRIYAAEQVRVTVRIPDQPAYDIVIGDGIIDHLGFMLAGKGWASPIGIVTDSNVGWTYGNRVRSALGLTGTGSFIHTMQAGEENKTLRTVEDIYASFAAHNFERNSVALALGGGVVGDTAGFAAATFMRGIALAQVPTTLLAMVDSSIGGKTGVDASFGKNMIGAFKQPDLVVMDLSVLRSLPPLQISAGMAEVIKSAIIDGGVFWDEIQEIRFKNIDAQMQNQEHKAKGQAGTWSIDVGLLNFIVRSIDLKRRIVEEDPFEQGRRAFLNLGHTFGHGIEAWSNYQILHGQGVGLGMMCAVTLSYAMGLCERNMIEQIRELLISAGLPTKLSQLNASLRNSDIDAIWHIMQNDKKKRGGKLRFILLRKPGDLVITSDVDESEVRKAIAAIA
ncbi:MAG: 3-dehydroquinate synthase [Chloroflexi bacterium]|nr:3-dehydroquinate synthase [Chloroflexota bacterium]